MYNNLSLYYLNQLGITPWLRRNEQESELTTSEKSLLVLVSGKTDKMVSRLLKRMLRVINLPENNYYYLSPTEDLKNLSTMCYAEEGVLLDCSNDHFSASLKTIKQWLPSHWHYLKMTSPEHLLQHPYQKKQAFMQLMEIDHLLKNQL